MSNAFDISKTPIHIGDSQTVFALSNFTFDGQSFEQYIGEHCLDGPGWLMMIEESPANWGSWERHPAGVEIVHVLRGSGTFFQDLPEGVSALPFGPGITLINPPGVWHTADVSEPMQAIYITPCPDTEHKPR